MARRCRAAIRHAILSATFAVPAALPVVTAVTPASMALGIRLSIDRIEHVGEREAVDLGAFQPAVTSAINALDITSIDRSHGRISLGWVLQAVWVVRIATSPVPVALALLGFRRLRRRGSDWPPADIIVRSLSDHRAPSPTRFVLHDTVVMPLTFGTSRPVVALPAAAAQWDVEAL